jgi:fermentation-respiration switch protein FrsA (DUF1100 family)
LALLLFPVTGCVNNMLYRPWKPIVATPAAKGLDHDQVSFLSGDGTRLTGWFIKARKPPVATVLQYHGNNENISGNLHKVGWLTEEGFNVFLFDYRGYGASEGKPTRAGMHRDSVEALKYVCSRPDVEDVVVWGQSLGGTLALAAFAEVKSGKVKAMAIESTFYSYQTIVRDAMWKPKDLGSMMLSYLLVPNKGSACYTINQIPGVPLLLVHGRNDRVVGFAHAERLYRRARTPPAVMWTDNGHVASIGTNLARRAELVAFFRSGLGAPSHEAPGKLSVGPEHAKGL